MKKFLNNFSPFTKMYTLLVVGVALSCLAVSALQTPITMEELIALQSDNRDWEAEPDIQPRTAAEVKQKSCSCGVRNYNGVPRIIGGVVTKTGEIPWRVGVFVHDKKTKFGGMCGGTLISPNWVLTAAHCTMHFVPGKSGISVIIGAQANPVTRGDGHWLESDRYIEHPEFDPNILDNDIALVHVSTPIQYRPNVSPACLPWNMANNEFQGVTVIASGWGTTRPVPVGVENRDPLADTLKVVELPFMTTQECSPYMQVTDNQVCTYAKGKDSCQGDSGGSIDYRHTDGFYYSLGVVSYGFGCAQDDYPGVYTKVTKYLDWIQQNTQEDFCKK